MLRVDCRASVLVLPPVAATLPAPAWPSASTLALSPRCAFPPPIQYMQDMRPPEYQLPTTYPVCGCERWLCSGLRLRPTGCLLEP